MYYQNYEDYMRSVLGYSSSNPDIYEKYPDDMFSYPSTYSNTERNIMVDLSEEEIEGLYPDIYHLVIPMINKACEANSKPYTRELIEKMTDEIYMAMETNVADVVVNIRAEGKQVAESENIVKKAEVRGEKTTNLRKELKREVSQSTRQEPKKEVIRSENRDLEREGQTRQRNSLLRDLIKILLLNRVIGGRPNYPPRPPRPPFPGGPGMPPPRPPYPGGRPPMGGPNMPPPRPPYPGGRPPMGGPNMPPPRPPYPGGRPPMPRDYLDFE